MSFPPSVPEAFVRTQRALRGEAGLAWLRRLPSLTKELAGRWSLEVGSPFPDLSYNWVVPALRADGTPAVLKLSFPEDKEFRTEASALAAFGGRGICRLLELDLERGAMLLERLLPGTDLTSVEDDEEATTIAAGVIKKLRRPAPRDHAFPTVAGWAGGRVDRLMMGAVDVLYALPFIFFVILLVVFFGRNFVLMFLAVTLLYFVSAFAINRIALFIEKRVQVPGMIGGK